MKLNFVRDEKLKEADFLAENTTSTKWDLILPLGVSCGLLCDGAHLCQSATGRIRILRRLREVSFFLI